MMYWRNTDKKLPAIFFDEAHRILQNSLCFFYSVLQDVLPLSVTWQTFGLVTCFRVSMHWWKKEIWVRPFFMCIPYLLVYKSTFYDPKNRPKKSSQKIALDWYTSHTQRPDQAIQEISITIAWSPLRKPSLQNQF